MTNCSDFEIFGRYVGDWLQIYYCCHNKSGQWCWPDGNSLYEQSNFLIQIFGVIDEEIALKVKQDSRKK